MRNVAKTPIQTLLPFKNAGVSGQHISHLFGRGFFLSFRNKPIIRSGFTKNRLNLISKEIQNAHKIEIQKKLGSNRCEICCPLTPPRDHGSSTFFLGNHKRNFTWKTLGKKNSEKVSVTNYCKKETCEHGPLVLCLPREGKDAAREGGRNQGDAKREHEVRQARAPGARLTIVWVGLLRKPSRMRAGKPCTLVELLR